MHALSPPLAMPAIDADVDADVYCPMCGYELPRWEVHLLKLLLCPCCAARLELGIPLDTAALDLA